MVERRFLTLPEVAETLSISAAQTYALVRTQQLRAIKIGGRGQYRVEVSALEEYIARMYDETARYLQEHPFGSDAELAEETQPASDAPR